MYMYCTVTIRRGGHSCPILTTRPSCESEESMRLVQVVNVINEVLFQAGPLSTGMSMKLHLIKAEA